MTRQRSLRSPRSTAALESLESRRLLAAVLTHTGTLVITGTDQADRIDVLAKPGKIVVKQTPVTFGGELFSVFRAADVRRIVVEGRGGDDHLEVKRDVNERVTLAGGSGNDFLFGNYGCTLIGGAGDDTLYAPPRTRLNFETLKPEPNPDAPSLAALLSGGAGKDRLSGDQNDTVVGGRGIDLAGIGYVAFGTSKTPGQPITMPDLGSARDRFGPRAVGVERFSGEESGDGSGGGATIEL